MEGEQTKDVCDLCGSADAVVHLTQIENNQMSTSNLRDMCAAAKGVEGPDESELESMASELEAHLSRYLA